MTSSCSAKKFSGDDEGDVSHCIVDFTLHHFTLKKRQREPIKTFVPFEQLGMEGNQCRWNLEVRPLYTKGTQKKDCIYVNVGLESPMDVKVQAHCDVRITEKMGERIVVVADLRDFSMIFTGRDSDDETYILVPHDHLIKENYIVDDCLRIQAEIKFMVIGKSRPVRCPVSPAETVSKLLGQLYDSGCRADFILISSDGKEFPVHKFQLSLMSDVFAAMFEHDLIENKNGKCVIEDIDGETLSAMLKFIYAQTGWNSELAEKLIVAANKYGLASLEEDCTDELVSRLTAKKAAPLLCLADRHSIDKLRMQVLRFIANDVEAFVTAGGFEQLREDTDLLRLIRDSVGERKSKKLKVSA